MTKVYMGKTQCPLCGIGMLTQKTTYQHVMHKGKEKCLPLHFSVCSYCESEQANEQQLLANKMAMFAFEGDYMEPPNDTPDL